jgi:type IV pilus assembly protein PilB
MSLLSVFQKRDDLAKGPLLRKDAGALADACPDSESIRGLSDLYVPEKTNQPHLRDIGDVLLEIGKITSEALEAIRQQSAQDPAYPASDIATLLLNQGLCDSDDILMAKAEMCGRQFQHIEPDQVERQAFEKLDRDFIKGTSLCPIAIEGRTLVVATSEPANIFTIEDVKRRTGMDLRVVVCPQAEIDAVCNAFAEEKLDQNLDDIISDIADVEVVEDQEADLAEDLEKMAGQSPIIKFVNYLISNAIREGASDIHIEPKEKSSKIRYRIDGVLFETMQSPLKMHPAVVSRVKIMSNLDISERRLPQDGKVKVSVAGRPVDLRVSTLPTNHGEKVVIRILDSRSILRGLNDLGMEPQVMETFDEQIALPHGILLVTGPTGSGKSTTLYTALAQMDGERLNISTVEDPVEYELDFCNQVQTHEKIGLDFASALRSLLRQDPDVIMIGEIRDNQTARIAVQAALTGHLVLSTLHTNDAASSVTRLVNIGVDAYLIAASLNAVLAQRLVRRICPKCKTTYEPAESLRKYIESAELAYEQLVRGAGCDFCRQSGYAGRVGIYELLVIDDRFRDMINRDASVNNMRRAFHESGQPSLFDDGINKVRQGMTTIEEVLRVTRMSHQNDERVLAEDLAQ